MAELRKNGGTQLFQASSVGLCQLQQWLMEGHFVYTMIGLKQGFSYATSTLVRGVVGDFLDTSNGRIEYAKCTDVEVTPMWL